MRSIHRVRAELAELVALAYLIQMQFATWSRKLVDVLYPA